jgi:hypothetical protein
VPFAPPPASAAWLHQGSRSGFEVVHIAPNEGGYHLEGCTTGIDGLETWITNYDIWLDPTWTTQRARISSRSTAGWRSTSLSMDATGSWEVDGQAAPHLHGCRDVDLESSAMTNAFPVHRMSLRAGGRGVAPAAYVRAAGLEVERLEQTYVRLTDDADQQRYDYVAPAFAFACLLTYDPSGFVLDYPGIAIRAG